LEGGLIFEQEDDVKLISEVEIDHFRSIKYAKIDSLGHFTAFAGLNNSGKSNVLRAIHAFFTRFTDSGILLDVSKDYYKQDLSKKKAKKIRISITFDLPSNFNFRKGLEPAKKLLSDSFKITKEWIWNNPEPLYYLNGAASPLPRDEQAKVDQFLGLISFRYIPNRVLPLDIIRDEHKALRDVLVRRLARKAKNQNEVFDAIKETSATLIKTLSDRVHNASADVGTVRLATPSSWQDIIFAFGYKLATGDVEIDDAAQGSGIQSLLMLETLSLIDRDYFQKFGWRQAAIWALEEPESSLHSSLEARVADYLAEISSDDDSRLQILSTTHSDLMLQHSDRAVFTKLSDGVSNFNITTDKSAVLEEAAQAGISRWVHPILTEPLNPIVIVEGKFDYAFVEEALHLLAPSSKIRVSYLEKLQGGGVTGGDDAVIKYIKANVRAIRTRVPSAPVIVLLDWDSANKKKELEKLITPADPCMILSWPDTTFNPTLGKTFRGIERHMSDRIITEADKVTNAIATKDDGTKTIEKDVYGSLKQAVYEVVMKGLNVDDLQYAKPFIEEIVKQVSLPKAPSSKLKGMAAAAGTVKVSASGRKMKQA
jgi:AAA15 family ATPase/GTPase